MLSKLLETKINLEKIHLDLVEIELHGGEINDILDQIADLAQRMITDVANAMLPPREESDE